MASLTKNQTLVLSCLKESEGPMSAYDILGQLKETGIKAPLQVYRALEKLMDIGAAHRLESLNAFVACADGHCHAKGMLAFAICSDCGDVQEFSDAEVQSRLAGWATQNGFRADASTVELRGLCANCAA